MEPSRGTLLLRAGGLLLHLAGLAAFLFVALDVYLAAPSRPFSSVSTVQLVAMGVSLAVSVAGRAVSWRFGGGRGGFPGGPAPRRDQSPLEQLGYRSPPDPREDVESGVACRECGARNDPAFSYCRDCSAELPDRK